MGLIHNLSISIIHLVFAAMDILLLTVLLKVIHDRWQLAWLAQVNAAITPLINHITATMQNLAMRITDKIYPEKTLLLILICGLLLVRLVIVGFI